MGDLKGIFKKSIYTFMISLFFVLIFYISDRYIFPDACGFILFSPILILAYLAIIVSGAILLIVSLLRYMIKGRNKEEK